jgi:hypothetical protein
MYAIKFLNLLLKSYGTDAHSMWSDAFLDGHLMLIKCAEFFEGADHHPPFKKICASMMASIRFQETISKPYKKKDIQKASFSCLF